MLPPDIRNIDGGTSRTSGRKISLGIGIPIPTLLSCLPMFLLFSISSWDIISLLLLFVALNVSLFFLLYTRLLSSTLERRAVQM